MNTRTISEQHMDLLNHLASGNTWHAYLKSTPEAGDHTLTRAVRDTLEQVRWLTSLRPQHARAFYKWTDEEDRRLLEMDAAGSPLWSVSKELMRSKQSVSRRLEELKQQQGGAE